RSAIDQSDQQYGIQLRCSREYDQRGNAELHLRCSQSVKNSKLGHERLRIRWGWKESQAGDKFWSDLLPLVEPSRRGGGGDRWGLWQHLSRLRLRAWMRKCIGTAEL